MSCNMKAAHAAESQYLAGPYVKGATRVAPEGKKAGVWQGGGARAYMS